MDYLLVAKKMEWVKNWRITFLSYDRNLDGIFKELYIFTGQDQGLLLRMVLARNYRKRRLKKFCVHWKYVENLRRITEMPTIKAESTKLASAIALMEAREAAGLTQRELGKWASIPLTWENERKHDNMLRL